MAEQTRLTLSPEKTHITHVDDGFEVGACASTAHGDRPEFRTAGPFGRRDRAGQPGNDLERIVGR
jgi:hypothetical protein